MAPFVFCVLNHFVEMEKSAAIRNALKRLGEDLGRHSFVIADHWEDDRIAIAVAASRDTSQLVYFCQSESDDDILFDYELEIAPAKQTNKQYEVAGRGRRVNYEELREIVREHLGLNTKGVHGTRNR